MGMIFNIVRVLFLKRFSVVVLFKLKKKNGAKEKTIPKKTY